jgi:hypothetical protein
VTSTGRGALPGMGVPARAGAAVRPPQRAAWGLAHQRHIHDARLLPLRWADVRVLVAAFLLAAAVAFVLTWLSPRPHEARATLLMGPVGGAVSADIDALLASRRLAELHAELAVARPVLMEVIERLRLEATPEDVADAIRSGVAPETGLVEVVVADEDPARARLLADTVAEVLVARQALLWPEIPGRWSIDADLAALASRIVALRGELTTLTALPGLSLAELDRLAEVRRQLVALTVTYAGLLPASSAGTPAGLAILEPAALVDRAGGPPLVPSVLGGLLGVLAALPAVLTRRRPEWLHGDAPAAPQRRPIPAPGAAPRPGKDVGEGTQPAGALPGSPARSFGRRPGRFLPDLAGSRPRPPGEGARAAATTHVLAGGTSWAESAGATAARVPGGDRAGDVRDAARDVREVPR